MTNYVTRVSVTAAALMWGALASAQTPNPDAATGDAGKGRQLFMTVGCSYCHGTAGQGGGGRTGGLRLAQMPIPFEAFLYQLRHPANEMPPYVDTVLSDQDVRNIFAFVARLPPPPDVATIPILNR